MGDKLKILNVMGPYREPREPTLSFDYSIQMSHWPTPQGVRVKVSLEEELDYFKIKILDVSGGSPGQQLLVNRILTSAIADQKLYIAYAEGMFEERRDVMVDLFTGQYSYLFPRLESWMNEERDRLRKDIQDQVGL